MWDLPFVLDFSYSKGRLHIQPQNREATEGNVYQLFPKSKTMTFHSLRKMTTVQVSSLTDDLLSMATYPNHWWVISYLLQDYSETARRVMSSPLTGVLHKSKGLSPRDVAQHYTLNEQRPSRWRAIKSPRVLWSNGVWKDTCYDQKA